MTDKAQLDVGARRGRGGARMKLPTVAVWRYRAHGCMFAIVYPALVDGVPVAGLYRTNGLGVGLWAWEFDDWEEVKGHRDTELFAGCTTRRETAARALELFGPEGGES